MKRASEKRGPVILLKLLAAGIAWLLVFFLCLRIGGGGLTLFFEVPPDADGYALTFSPEGIAMASQMKTSADGTELAVRLVPVGHGETDALLHWDGLGEQSLYDSDIESHIRSYPGGILFDDITWNFSGWELFTACFFLFLLTAAVIFFLESRRERKRVFFSYRATAELGIAIFLLVASLVRVDMLCGFLRGENVGTVWSFLVSTIVTAQTFVRRTAFVIVGFALVTAASNFVLMRHEGVRPANMLGLAVSLVMVGGAALGIWMSRSMLQFPLRNVLLNVYAGLFVYFECLLAATIIRSVIAGRHEPAYDKDYVLVLGCRIRPDGTLYPLIRGRVDRAINFVNAQFKATGKRAVLVPSGGKGGDEPLSEGEAMARYMREKGVPEEYILPETKSTTTRENLLFSRRLIEEKGSVGNAAFSSSSYHVYRSGILASEVGWDLDGMGSRTKWYFWPNAFLREFIGLMAAQRLQQLAAMGVIVLITASITTLVM